MQGASGKIAAIFERPIVGRQLGRDAALGQRDRQRLGGKEMAAGAAGGDEHAASVDHAGSACAGSFEGAGRLRVKATRKPMPTANANSEEPP